MNKIKGEKEKDIKGREEGKLVYEDEDVKIILPLTEAAAIYYGRGTKWCTAAKKNNTFEEYNEDGPLHILIPKNPKYDKEKYQIQFSTSSYSDDKDDQVYWGDIMDRFPLLDDIYVYENQKFLKDVLGLNPLV